LDPSPLCQKSIHRSCLRMLPVQQVPLSNWTKRFSAWRDDWNGTAWAVDRVLPYSVIDGHGLLLITHTLRSSTKTLYPCPQKNPCNLTMPSNVSCIKSSWTIPDGDQCSCPKLILPMAFTRRGWAPSN
jgi:hypothetical protein